MPSAANSCLWGKMRSNKLLSAQENSQHACLHLCFNHFILEHLAFLEVRFRFFFVRVLPEDEWFNEICQDAMERLSGKPKAIDGDREVNSPTASVSAQSISSVRSHGSS